ncbi:MAG: acyloxyacyl hydrolase [Rhodanobacter sp.]
MDAYPTNAAFAVAVFASRRIGDSHFSWAPDVSAGWINGRNLVRYDGSGYSTRDDVWLVAAGARIQYGEHADGHGVFLSVQPALQSGRTLALSGGFEFVSTLGWQGRHLSVQIRHVSNAGIEGPNRGETMALVGVGFDL